MSKHIVLTRTLPGGAVQNHNGYLGDNTDLLILSGQFHKEVRNIPSTAPRTRFGWFALATAFWALYHETTGRPLRGSSS